MLRLIRKLFSVDVIKCKALFELYMCQMELQLKDAATKSDEYNTTKLISARVEQFLLVAYMPFLHFIMLYNNKAINKRELKTILTMVCNEVGQPPTIVYQVLSNIHNSIPHEQFANIATDDWKTRQDNFALYGALPLITLGYKEVIDNNTNIFSVMLDVADKFDELNNEQQITE